MLFKQRLTGLALFVLLGLSVLVWGGASAGAGDNFGLEVASLSLMPFGSSAKPIRSNWTGNDIAACELIGICAWQDAGEGRETLTELYRSSLARNFGDRLRPADETAKLFAGFNHKDGESLRDAAVRFGKLAGTSHVMVGTVWRYVERVGGNLGVESPASVAFTSLLIRVDDGAVRWTGRFDKTQEPLSKNLADTSMLMKTGFKWLTARDLARYGVEQVLDSAPWRR